MKPGSERYGSLAALWPLLWNSCLAQPVVMRRDDALVHGIDEVESERWSCDAQIELSCPVRTVPFVHAFNWRAQNRCFMKLVCVLLLNALELLLSRREREKA